MTRVVASKRLLGAAANSQFKTFDMLKSMSWASRMSRVPPSSAGITKNPRLMMKTRRQPPVETLHDGGDGQDNVGQNDLGHPDEDARGVVDQLQRLPDESQAEQERVQEATRMQD